MAHKSPEMLLDILDQERTAILEGRYNQLPDFALQKEQGLHALATTPTERRILVDIKAKMDENQRLVAAALRGVKAAQQRVAALQEIRDGLSVYDPSGKLSLVSTSPHNIEKKA